MKVLAALLFAATVVGCTSGPIPTPTPTARPTRAPASPSPDPFNAGHYDDGALAFDYPADWNTARPWYPSSVSELKAYLSSEELREPCVISGSATLCRAPVTGLSPGGFLFSWWRWGLNRGAPGPDPTAGDLIHVGGRSARIHDSGAEGHCLSMDADATLRFEIPDPTLNGSWTILDACMREPIVDARAALDAMLASVTWSGPEPSRMLPMTTSNFHFQVQVYDETGLVTGIQEGSGGSVGDPTATVNGNSLEIRWLGGACGPEPSIGLSQAGGRLLILLEPDAGKLSPEVTDCPAILLSFIVVLTLNAQVNQNDVHLEVW